MVRFYDNHYYYYYYSTAYNNNDFGTISLVGGHLHASKFDVKKMQ